MSFYKVEGYEGVAWRRASPEEVRVPTDPDETAALIMVGDDRVFLFDWDEVHLLNDDQFCHECGQIGCPHGRRGD